MRVPVVLGPSWGRQRKPSALITVAAPAKPTLFRLGSSPAHSRLPCAVGLAAHPEGWPDSLALVLALLFRFVAVLMLLGECSMVWRGCQELNWVEGAMVLGSGPGLVWGLLSEGRVWYDRFKDNRNREEEARMRFPRAMFGVMLLLLFFVGMANLAQAQGRQNEVWRKVGQSGNQQGVVTTTPAPYAIVSTPTYKWFPKCDPAYPTVCIPPPPPYFDCPGILYENFTVLPPDPHSFDLNDNGIGCDFYDLELEEAFDPDPGGGVMVGTPTPWPAATASTGTTTSSTSSTSAGTRSFSYPSELGAWGR
jgi:hypothetical protein